MRRSTATHLSYAPGAIEGTDKGGATMSEERVLWGIGSARALRVHWALIELGLEYRSERIQSRSGETETAGYRRLNPRGKIPVLEDGGLVLTESAAIVTYLAETYGGGRLIPAGGAERARYFEWISFVSMEIDATALYVLRRHEALAHIYGEAPTANAAARGYFDRMITAAVHEIEDGRRYLLGTEFSGADIVMTTCLDWARSYEVPLPEPWLDYLERTVARPAHARAVAANTVD